MYIKNQFHQFCLNDFNQPSGLKQIVFPQDINLLDEKKRTAAARQYTK